MGTSPHSARRRRHSWTSIVAPCLHGQLTSRCRLSAVSAHYNLRGKVSNLATEGEDVGLTSGLVMVSSAKHTKHPEAQCRDWAPWACRIYRVLPGACSAACVLFLVIFLRCSPWRLESQDGDCTPSLLQLCCREVDARLQMCSAQTCPNPTTSHTRPSSSLEPGSLEDPCINQLIRVFGLISSGESHTNNKIEVVVYFQRPEG
jgi:hypothetical protein